MNQSTGKTTSLLISGILVGIPSSKSKMALISGDGTKTGTTMYVEITKIILKVGIVQSILKIVNNFLLIISFYKTRNYLITVMDSLT